MSDFRDATEARVIMWPCEVTLELWQDDAHRLGEIPLERQFTAQTLDEAHARLRSMGFDVGPWHANHRNMANMFCTVTYPRAPRAALGDAEGVGRA